jgi:uncharacterized protein (DUF1015 family)
MEIRPFRGWRFRTKGGDVSPHIAPPYDILSQADKDALLRRSEANIVAADLPHVPPKEVGPDAEYRRAADTLRQWKRSGLLLQEDRPALYVHEQTFTWAGRTYARRGLICGVRAAALGEGVIPHENTFAGPKADRLKLTRHTRMQLSPIFGLYRDREGRVASHLAAAADRKPNLFGVLHGVQERLWVVGDESVIEEIVSGVADVPVHIADGHHRYVTAVDYRDALSARDGVGDDHEANFVMFVLVARDDPGLLVLPTHRLIRGLRDEFALEALVEACGDFDWQDVDASGVDLHDAHELPARFGPGAMAFIGPRGRRVAIARLKNREAMARAAPDEPEHWRELDVAVLHRLIIDTALSAWKTDRFTVDYTPDAAAALEACRSGAAQLAACLQGTPLEAVERIGKAGAVMPHKSTYFYPKVPTGLILKPLE